MKFRKHGEQRPGLGEIEAHRLHHRVGRRRRQRADEQLDPEIALHAVGDRPDDRVRPAFRAAARGTGVELGLEGARSTNMKPM